MAHLGLHSVSHGYRPQSLTAYYKRFTKSGKTCIATPVYIWMCVCVCVCVYICMSVSMCVYVCMCVMYEVIVCVNMAYVCVGETLFSCHSLEWSILPQQWTFMSPQCLGLLSNLPEAH